MPTHYYTFTIEIDSYHFQLGLMSKNNKLSFFTVSAALCLKNCLQNKLLERSHQNSSYREFTVLNFDLSDLGSHRHGAAVRYWKLACNVDWLVRRLKPGVVHIKDQRISKERVRKLV